MYMSKFNLKIYASLSRGKEGEEECYQAAYAHIKSPLEYLTARYLHYNYISPYNFN